MPSYFTHRKPQIPYMSAKFDGQYIPLLVHQLFVFLASFPRIDSASEAMSVLFARSGHLLTYTASECTRHQIAMQARKDLITSLRPAERFTSGLLVASDCCK